jgi:Cu-Zn family superoxide dismutase
MDYRGQIAGTVKITEAVTGSLVEIDIKRIIPGAHALHFHENCDCTLIDNFRAAGDHINLYGTPHGFLHENGPHPGTFPNIHVPLSGRLRVDFFANNVFLEQEYYGGMKLLDKDGSSLIIRNTPDDYLKQPTIVNGRNLACASLTVDKLRRKPLFK